MLENLSPLERLENMGFREVGQWSIELGKIKFTFIDAASAKNVLYAFISQDTVMYIGKTVQTLKQRMGGYKNPAPSQSTNIKGNKLISEILLTNHPVAIYALPDNGLLFYGGFHVNLAAGLEDNLIKALNPPWNRTGLMPSKTQINNT
jgi:hypothetical protein